MAPRPPGGPFLFALPSPRSAVVPPTTWGRQPPKHLLVHLPAISQAPVWEGSSKFLGLPLSDLGPPGLGPTGACAFPKTTCDRAPGASVAQAAHTIEPSARLWPSLGVGISPCTFVPWLSQSAPPYLRGARDARKEGPRPPKDWALCPASVRPGCPPKLPTLGRGFLALVISPTAGVLARAPPKLRLVHLLAITQAPAWEGPSKSLGMHPLPFEGL